MCNLSWTLSHISSDSNSSEIIQRENHEKPEKPSKEEECLRILQDYTYEIEENINPENGKIK